MKANRLHSTSRPKRSLSAICLNSCRKLLAQLDAIKQSLIWDYEPLVHGQEAVLHSALNEAEALAWQTPFPHLFYPALAEEKAISVRQWAARQEWIRERLSWTRAFAA